MSQASETRKIIVERNDRIGNTNLFRTIGLYSEGNKVVFSANFSSPEPSDASYCVFYEIDVEDYRKGIEELRQTGRCELKDLNACLSPKPLVITANSEGGKVSFETYGRYYFEERGSFITKWTSDQIALPGTPPSCKAKQEVPAVYEGERWG